MDALLKQLAERDRQRLVSMIQTISRGHRSVMMELVWQQKLFLRREVPTFDCPQHSLGSQVLKQQMAEELKQVDQSHPHGQQYH